MFYKKVECVCIVTTKKSECKIIAIKILCSLIFLSIYSIVNVSKLKIILGVLHSKQFSHNEWPPL